MSLRTCLKQVLYIFCRSGLAPLTIGLGLTAIHLSFGLTSGAAINPARDLAPRLLSFAAGWQVSLLHCYQHNLIHFEKDSFTAANHWFWIPWLLPHVGGLLGAALYKVMVGLHHPEQ